MRRTLRSKGVTLLEIMISMLVILVGMLGLYRAVSASVRGSSTALRYSQAQTRVQQVIEAIRTSPESVMSCLASTPASNWGAAGSCESQCKTTFGPTATLQACVFSTLGNSKQDEDPGHQQYAVVYDAADPTGPWSTFVRQTGATGRVYDIQVTVGWNDDTGAAAPPTRRVTMRQAIYQ